MVKTTKIQGGANYATVPDRLKEFRTENPRAKVETSHQFLEDGSLVFSCYILKDKSDENSADATGTAMYTPKDLQKAKSFEKLETVSVGRALSLLGYLNNGQVASTEEMTEFNQYQEDKLEEAIDHLRAAADIAALKDVFMSLGSLMAHSKVIDAKNARKEELLNASN
jgi:hypothetical protein